MRTSRETKTRDVNGRPLAERMRVYDATDERHEGIVVATMRTWVKVRWLESGWFTRGPARSFKLKEE